MLLLISRRAFDRQAGSSIEHSLARQFGVALINTGLNRRRRSCSRALDNSCRDQRDGSDTKPTSSNPAAATVSSRSSSDPLSGHRITEGFAVMSYY